MRVIIALAFFSQWSGNGLVSYYLTKVLNGIGITGQGEQLLINGILQIYNYATAIVGALVVDKAGRRTLFLVSTAGMCAMFSIWTAASATYWKSATFNADGDPMGGNAAAGRVVLVMIFFYYGFYNIALSPHLISYTVEILPYRIRAKGLMVLQVCVNASLVFNQYVNPIAMDALNWRYYIVYCVWIAFEFVYLYFTVIETKGKNGPLPLEEIAALFDGDEGSKAIAAQGVNHAQAAEHERNPEDVKYDEARAEKISV
jgi:MFS family permease